MKVLVKLEHYFDFWLKFYSKTTPAQSIQHSSSKSYLLSVQNKRTKRLVLLLHGGAFEVGYSLIYKKLSQFINETLNFDVASLDYRVSPNIFPAALDDALEAYKFYSLMYPEIIVIGDSAGGNLALALGLQLQILNLKSPFKMVLISPWTDLACDSASWRRNFHVDHIFGASRHASFSEDLVLKTDYSGEIDLKNPLLSPKFAEYKKFCPVLIQVGGDECLLDDSVVVYEKLKKVTDARMHVFDGMFHVFQCLFPGSPEGKVAWKEIAEFLKE